MTSGHQLITVYFNKIYKNHSPLFFEGLVFFIIITVAKIPVTWSTLSDLRFFSPTIFFSYLVLRYRTKIKFPQSINKINIATALLLSVHGLLSLIWASNLTYGINKLIGLSIIELPLICSAFMLGNIYGEKFIKVLESCFIIVGILLTIFFFVTGPFSYNNVVDHYGYTHVGYGRLISYAFLLSLFNVILNKDFSLLMFITTALLGSGLFLSGLRGAIIAVLSTMGFFLYNRSFADLKNSAFRLVGLILLIFLFVYFQPTLYSSVKKRIVSISTVVISKDVSDGSINSRIQAYEISFNMFLEKPFFGQGIGGYNQVYKNNELPKTIEYPHNLLVEIVVELGLIGFILFGILFWRTARNIRKINEIIFLIFTNSLLLSLFSGNIADQKILIVLVGTFTVLPNTEKNIFHRKVVMRENHGQ